MATTIVHAADVHLETVFPEVRGGSTRRAALADAFERIVDLARTASVELMTHPQRQNEFDLLMGEDFGHVISSVQRTGFDAL